MRKIYFLFPADFRSDSAPAASHLLDTFIGGAIS